jgi:5-dehydro-2-deoxygluconokinase
LAAEQGRACGAKVVLDLDFRPDQWHDARAFGQAVRSVLPLVDIMIGTGDEINAAMLQDASQIQLSHSQVSDTQVRGDTQTAIIALMALGPNVVVEKTGAQGARVHLETGEMIKAPGFPVEVYNILGAGDAFASGFLYGFVKGWDWYKSVRLGNACGAIVVTKHGCANFMPTMAEALQFAEAHGGLG